MKNEISNPKNHKRVWNSETQFAEITQTFQTTNINLYQKRRGIVLSKESRLSVKKAEYEGKVFKSNRFGDVIVLEYLNNKQVIIKFLDTGYTTEENLSSVKSGYIRDRSLPTTCGVGFVDIEGASIGRKVTLEYSIWNNMLNRCYNENMRDSNQTYADCEVSDNFKYLSYFKEWCNKQIGFNNKGWQLDKDILVKGNKVYSETTCCFVPQEINTLIVKADNIRGKCPVGVYFDKERSMFKVWFSADGKGVYKGRYNTPEEAFQAYKQAKESYIKVVANKWKGQIDSRVYNALMGWEINIED